MSKMSMVEKGFHLWLSTVQNVQNVRNVRNVQNEARWCPKYDFWRVTLRRNRYSERAVTAHTHP